MSILEITELGNLTTFKITIPSMKKVQVLNESDIEIIKKLIRQNYKAIFLAAFICLVINFFIYIIINQTYITNWHQKNIHIYFLVTWLIIVLLIAKYLNQKYYNDLSSNKKYSKIFIVTDKSSRKHIKQVGTVFTEIPYLREYYLSSNKERYLVNKELYSKINLQDTICIFYSSKSKIILNIEKYEAE